ncbi:MAG: hypothetical protein E7311_06270 [Clostridiales bacterium]|nr:hypothetical protein [Clostridiales bacterium]
MNKMKKFSALFIIFMVFIMMMFISSLLINMLSAKGVKEYKEFEEKINLVAEKINYVYITKGEYVGIKMNTYSDKEKYNNAIKEIQKIYNKNILSEDYYFLDNDSKNKLGINNIEGNFVVNYNSGEVYNLNPLKYKGKTLYTIGAISGDNMQSTDYSYNVPIIPNGFRYLTGNWDTGFVITDENGNEFVWVPVGWINEETPSKALKRYYDTFDQDENTTEEFKKIKESVDKYGGFYIGRYEASLKGATSTSDKGNTNILQVKKEIMPLSNVSFSTEKYKYVYEKKDNGLIDVNIPVYNGERLEVAYGYNKNGEITQKTLDTVEEVRGAIEMARQMATDYNWDKSINTTLIYSEQLDTVVKIIERKNFLQNKQYEKENAITENNMLWGNFIESEFRYTIGNTMYTKNKNEGKLLPTGVTTYKVDEDTENYQNQVFNIYDLAGNLYELTMEERLEYIIVRGGSFDTKGSNNISKYKRIQKNDIWNNVGIRVVMYID